MTNQVDAWPGGATYALVATYTQPVGAPANMGVRIQPGAGNEMIVLFYKAILTSAAAKTVAVIWEDSTPTNVATLDSASLTTGQDIKGPGLMTKASTVTGSTAGILGSGQVPFGLVISGTDQLRFDGAGLANTDTLQVFLRARMKIDTLPTRTVVGAGVTEGSVTSVML